MQNNIHTESDYKAALAEIERLFNCAPSTAKENQLDKLVDQVKAYGAEHYPIGPPTIAAEFGYEAEKRVLVALNNKDRMLFSAYLRRMTVPTMHCFKPRKIIIGERNSAA